MLKNSSFINGSRTARSFVTSVFRKREFSKNTSALCALVLLLCSAVLSAGCTKRDDTGVSYVFTGDLIYSEGAAVPECGEENFAYELLRHVTYPEYLYFGGVTGGAPIFTRDIKNAILHLKNRFAMAVAEGNGLSEAELEELETNTKDAFYLMYQTDAEKRGIFERKFDTYDSERFCEAVYGMPFSWYMQVMREEAAAEKQIHALMEKIAPGITGESIYEYYLANKNCYEFAEADIILTAAAPEDMAEALRTAEAEAGKINEAADVKSAFEAAAEEFPETLSWREESGTAVLSMTGEYTGLYGEILKRTPDGTEDAYVLEYGENVYIVMCLRAGEYTKEQLEENGVSDTIREAIARKEAEEAADGFGITDIRTIPPGEAQ